MKHLALFLIGILFTGCGAQKHTGDKSDCPAGGTCTLEIIENKSLEIKENVTGKLYYTVKDLPGTNVAVYKFTRNLPGEYQDNFYTEEIVLEFTGKSISLSTVNKNSLLFGVGCYCKGKAGHYPFDSSAIMNINDGITISLPQIIDNQQLQAVRIVQ